MTCKLYLNKVVFESSEKKQIYKKNWLKTIIFKEPQLNSFRAEFCLAFKNQINSFIIQNTTESNKKLESTPIHLLIPTQS